MKFKNKKNFIAGFFMGAANTIPGVSGGSVALIFGIYERLIYTLTLLKPKNFFSNPKIIDWSFILSVFFGTILGVFSCVLFIPYLLKNFETPMRGLFLGLIIGSVPQLIKLYQKKIEIFQIILILTTSLFTCYFLQFSPILAHNQTAERLFFAGMIAMCAMLLPGISGSFVLLVLGCYNFVFSSIQRILFLEIKYLILLAPFLFGMILGAIFCVNIINYLLKNFRSVTLSVLSGLLFGSLPALWPFKNPLGSFILVPQEFNYLLVSTIILFWSGLLISLYIIRKN